MIALDLVHLKWNVSLLMKILTGSALSFCLVCYTFTFFFIKKKEKRKKKKERKTIVPRSWNTFSNRSFNVSYLAEESVKR